MPSFVDNFIAKISRVMWRAVEWHHMSKFHGSPSWMLYLTITAIFIAIGILMLWEPLMQREYLPRYVPR